MRIYALQHVWFEDPVEISSWAVAKRHAVKCALVSDGAPFPDPAAFDWLVVMGGPMSAYEENDYPWLVKEKRFIEAAVAQGKFVLGVCLGAQLIADVLGAKVYRNNQKEIGWFDVALKPDAKSSPLFKAWPARFTAFHWHGDTFALPAGARWIAESAACRHQAFEYENRVVGLQFHLESTPESVARLTAHGQADLTAAGPFVQPVSALKGTGALFSGIRANLYAFLDKAEAFTSANSFSP